MNCEKDIIPSPEIKKLKQECSLLRDELAGLFAERDHLLNTVAVNIQAQYATTVGVKEYEQLILDVEVRRLKRTIELIQTIENRGDKANLEQVEASVEEELEEWRKKVEKMLDEIKAGETRLKNLMTDEESQDLLKLYRFFAKKLHPDVNPDLDNKYQALWIRVQQAYKSGDIQELRALQLIVEDVPEETAISSTLEMLQKRHGKLKDQVNGLMQQIENIKAKHPFILADNLNDPEWVKEQISKCEERIKAFSAEKERLEDLISLWKSKQ